MVGSDQCKLHLPDLQILFWMTRKQPKREAIRHSCWAGIWEKCLGKVIEMGYVIEVESTNGFS
jgi:hypothetical protein